MKSFLVVPNRGQKVRMCFFGLERETPCAYEKEERLEQREIQE
jgi:hypothetical protein